MSNVFFLKVDSKELSYTQDGCKPLTETHSTVITHTSTGFLAHLNLEVSGRLRTYTKVFLPNKSRFFFSFSYRLLRFSPRRRRRRRRRLWPEPPAITTPFASALSIHIVSPSARSFIHGPFISRGRKSHDF